MFNCLAESNQNSIWIHSVIKLSLEVLGLKLKYPDYLHSISPCVDFPDPLGGVNSVHSLIESSGLSLSMNSVLKNKQKSGVFFREMKDCEN